MNTIKYLIALAAFLIILGGSCSAQSGAKIKATGTDTVSGSDFVSYKTGADRLCVVGYCQSKASMGEQFSCSKARAPYISSCCLAVQI